MGPILYERYIKPYTEKQWGRPARELSAQWAPRRVCVRWDNDPYLFPDPYQGWPGGPNGYTDLIDGLLEGELVELRTGVDVTIENLDEHAREVDADAIVLTCPARRLRRRVLRRARAGAASSCGASTCPHVEYAQGAMVVNYPGFEYPFIRIHETKHASGQKCEGTVLGFEFTGAPTRYYPIETAREQGAERPLPGPPARADRRRAHLLRRPAGQLPLHRHGRLHAPGARRGRGPGAAGAAAIGAGGLSPAAHSGPRMSGWRE